MSDFQVVLAFGGRDYHNLDVIELSLNRVFDNFGKFLLVQGGATGADEHAKEWGIANGLPTVTMHAAWDFYGKGAGIIRNEWMAKYLMPTYAVQFPGGTGTADMRKRCERLSIPIWEPCKESYVRQK